MSSIDQLLSAFAEPNENATRQDDLLSSVLNEFKVEDPAVRNRIAALAQLESSNNPSARGPEIKGGIHNGQRARGLLQVMPKTAEAYPEYNIEDDADAARAGVRYFLDNYSRFGDLDLATVAHHGGPGAALARLKNGSAGTVDRATGLATDDYLGRILELEGKSSGARSGPVYSRDAGEFVSDVAGERQQEARQKASDEAPFTTNLRRGWNQMTSSLANAADVAAGDEQAIFQRLQEDQKFDQENQQPTDTKRFFDQWRKENYAGALMNPAGAFGAMTEQLANSVPSMAGSIPGMIAGGSIGSAGGPAGALIGAAIGGFVGSAPGSVALETGGRITEMMARSGVDLADKAAVTSWLRENRDAILAEGAQKGMTVAAFDGLAGGIGTRIVAGPALKLAQAEANALRSIGVNAADAAAVANAKATPQFRAAIAPAKAEYDAATTVAQNAMRGTAAFTAETFGEGGGEYFGEMAATGQGNLNEALLEAAMAGGQSLVTTGAQFVGRSLVKPAQPNSPLTNATNAGGATAGTGAPGAPAGGAVPGATVPPSAVSPFIAAMDTDDVYGAWSNVRDGSDRAQMRDQIQFVANAYQGKVTASNRATVEQELAQQFKWFRAATPQQRAAAMDALAGGTPAGAASPANQAAAPAEPQLSEFDQRLAKAQSFVEDKAFLQALRGSEGYGKESVTEMLSAFAKARNPNLDPLIRERALADLEQFFETFARRPNFTMGASEQPAAAPGTQVAAPAPTGVAAVPPTDDGMTLEGEARIPPDRLAGANPNQLAAPPVHGLPAPDALKAKRDADAAYEQAFQDLVKAEQLGAADAELLAKQQAVAAAKAEQEARNARLAEIQQNIEGGRAQETAAKRRAVLDAVLADPQTANPLERFVAELKRQGFRDSVPSESELATIARFDDVKNATPDVADSTPNEFDPYIPPKQPAAQRPAAPKITVPQIQQAIAKGATLKNGTLTLADGTTHALKGPNLAAAKEAVRKAQGAASQQEQDSALNVTATPEPAPALGSERSVSGEASVEADDELEARQIIEIHEPRDKAKLNSLVSSMSENGWSGRPVLVWDTGNGRYALTGSHRLAAAKKAGVSVPVVYADADALERYAADHDVTIDQMVGAGDDRVEDMLREAGDMRAADLMAQEMQQAPAADAQNATAQPVSEQSAPDSASTPAQPVTATADAFDVSTRTDDQLRYLSEKGQPGWKEAATAELAKRTSNAPSEPASAPQEAQGTAPPAQQRLDEESDAQPAADSADTPVSSKTVATGFNQLRTALKILGDTSAIQSALEPFGIKSVPTKDGASVPNKAHWDEARKSVPLREDTYRLDDLAERYRDVTLKHYEDGTVSLSSNAVSGGRYKSADEALAKYREDYAGVTPQADSVETVAERVAEEATATPEAVSTWLDDINAMAQDAGWAEVGGRLVRRQTPQGEVVERTKWVPNAEWFVAGMESDPEKIRSAADKMARGERVNAKARRTISGMIEWLESQRSGEVLDEDSSAYDLEVAGYNEASPAVQDAFDAFDDLGQQMTEADAMRALGFTEEEINEAERESENGAAGGGSTVEGRAQAVPETGSGGQPASPGEEAQGFQLEAPTAEGLRAQAERAEQDEWQQPTKAQADAERDAVPFSLGMQSQPKPQGSQGGLFTPDGRVSETASGGRVSELSRLPKNLPENALIQFPSGRWGFVGSVHPDLAYEYKTGGKVSDEHLNAIRNHGGPAMDVYGVKRRAWGSKEEAITAANELDAQTSSAADIPAPQRFEAGKSLTKEQRKEVLKTLTDVYRAKGAPKEFKGFDQGGNERYGYAHSPDLFEKSDITGAMVRYYVTMPDGRIAHPSELFEDYTQAQIDAVVAEQESADRQREARDKLRIETLNSRKADSLNEANRLFNAQNRGRDDYTPAILTDGKQFLRTHPDSVEDDLRLLGDKWSETKAEQAKPSRTFRNIDGLNPLTAPVEDGDWFKIGDKDWQARNGYTGRGWALIDADKKTHPTINNIESNAVLIREIVQANETAQSNIVPAAVLSRVETALGRLREVVRRMQSVEKARGRGHIYALEWKEVQADINAAKDTLQKFRELAKPKGIDAEATIRDLGGEPDLSEVAPAEPVDPADTSAEPVQNSAENEQEDTFTEAEALDRMAWKDSGTEKGIRTHILEFFAADGNMETGRGAMRHAYIEQSVGKGGDKKFRLYSRGGDYLGQFESLREAKAEGKKASLPSIRGDGYIRDESQNASEPKPEQAAPDLSHLSALETSLSHERARLDAAKTDGERVQREVWVKQIEKEIAGERKRLGLPEQEASNLSDDELLAELGVAAEESPADPVADQWNALPENERVFLVRGVSYSENARQMRGDWNTLTEAQRETAKRIINNNATLVRALTSDVVSADEYPTDEVAESYRHISHHPGDAAKVDRNAFLTTIQSEHDNALPVAETDEQKAVLREEIEALKTEYLRREALSLGVRGNAYSAKIAGRGNLDSKGVARRNSALDRTTAKFSGWVNGIRGSVKDAVLSARNEDQLSAEQRAKDEKAAKRRGSEKAHVARLLNFKKGDGSKFGNYPIARVTMDRDGYPSSVTVEANDLTDNKFDIAKTLFGGDKGKLRAIVDEIRAEANDKPSGDMPAVARVYQSSEGVPVSEVSAMAAAFSEAYPAAPEIVVAATFDDLPQPVRASLESQGTRAVKGAMYRGVAYVVADNHDNARDVEETIFHEVLGHVGIRKLFGAEFMQKINQVFVGLGGIAGLQKIMDARGQGEVFAGYVRRVIAAKGSNPAVWTEAIANAVLTEEVYAHIAEQGSKGLMDRLQAIIGMVRDFLRRHGLMELANLNESDLLFTLSQARKALRGEEVTVYVGGPAVAKDPGFSIERSGFGANAPILVDGLQDIVQIPMDVQNRTRGRFLAKPVRLLNGRHFSKNRGYGVAHIAAEHSAEIGGNVAEWVVSVLRGATKIYDDGTGRLVLQSTGGPRGISVVELRDEGGFYSVVTAFDGVPRGRLVWSGRRLHLSSQGSGDTAKAVTTTAEQSASPSAKTAQSNDAKASQNRPLETLADQTNSGRVSPSDEEGNDLPPVARVADFLRTNDGRNTLRNRMADRFDDAISSDTVKTFGWWSKSVGSQRGKAKRSPEFARVYRKAHDFIDDVSRFANEAADRARSILPHMDTLGDVAENANVMLQYRLSKDYQAIAAPIFDGTLANGTTGKVFTDNELRATYGLSDEQIGMYRDFRKSVDFSLETLAASEMARSARAAKMTVADQSMSMEEATDFYMDQAQTAVDAAQEEVENLQLRHEAQRAERMELLRNFPRPEAVAAAIKTMEARQAVEMDKAMAALKEVEAFRDSFRDKADRVRQLQHEGYAPLMRFGQYTVDVVMRDEDGNPVLDEDGKPYRPFFGMFETESEARAAERTMRELYPDHDVKRGVLSQEASQLYRGVTPEAAELFASLLGVDQSEGFQTYLKQAVANRSAMKRLIERQGIDGFAKDVPRVLASFITSNARLASGNWNFGELAKAVQDIPQDKGDVKDEAIKLMQYIQNPQEEAAGIRGFLFFSFLGGSVASALVNTTQTITTTAPYLHQFAGNKVAGIIGSAMKLAGKAVHKGLDAIEDADLRAAMQQASEEGVVDPQEIHMLMAESGGGGNLLGQAFGLIKPDWRMPADRLGRAATRAWGSFFGFAEKYNRYVAFMSAWEVAGNMSPAELRKAGAADRYEFAKNAVTETQFEYRKHSRPNWSRGAVGSVLFTFKTFLINYVEFLARLPRKQQALALAALVLLSGMSGLPGADDLDDLIDAIGQKFGYNWNNKAGRHAWLVRTLGSDGANFVQHGISSVLPLDISARLGMGNLVPGTAVFKKSNTDKSRDVGEFFGPAGSMAVGAMDVWDAIGSGKDFDDLIRPIAPKAYRDAWQGIDIAQYDAYRDYKGRKVVDADGYDASIKGFGFHPNVVAEPKRVERMLAQSAGMVREIRTDIHELWAQGQAEGDADKVRAAQELMRNWNAKNPETPIRVNPASIAQRVRAMRMTSADRLVKATPREMRGMVRAEMEPRE